MSSSPRTPQHPAGDRPVRSRARKGSGAKPYVENPYTVSPHVGALTGEASAADHVQLPRTSRMAYVALGLASCGVFGLLLVPLGLLGTAGMVLGFKARRRIREDTLLIGDGLALAAIVTGAVMTVVVGAFFVMYFAFYGIPVLN